MSDVSKLPKWAQHRISKLEADCASMKREVETVLRGQADPRAAVLQFYDRDSYPLPVSGRVTFPRHGVEIYVDSEDELVLRANENLLVEPRAANVVHVISRDWSEKVMRPKGEKDGD